MSRFAGTLVRPALLSIIVAFAGSLSVAQGTTLSTRALDLQGSSRAALPIVSSEGVHLGARGLGLADACGTGELVLGPIDAPQPFNALGVHWGRTAWDGEVELFVATSSGHDQWSREFKVSTDHDIALQLQAAGRERPEAASDQTYGSLLFRTTNDGRRVRLRLRLTAASDCRGPEVPNVTLVFIDSTDGPSEAEILEQRARAAATGGPGRVEVDRAGHDHHRAGPLRALPKPSVISRSEWGAESPQCSVSYCQPTTHLAIHHTASTGDYNSDGYSDCAAAVRAIQRYHMYTNGWCDVGYNYLVCKHGLIWEGRYGGDNVRGAHDGYNCDSMGTSVLGYYHPPYNNAVTQASIDALIDLFAWKADQNTIDPWGVDTYRAYGGTVSTIYGHRDVKSTACPGDGLYAVIDQVRDGVAAKVDGTGPQTGNLVGIVFDAQDDHRLVGATATLDDGRSTTTDSNGMYRFDNLTAGQSYRVTASYPGYQTGSKTRTITAGIDNWNSIWLSPASSATVASR